MAENSKIEWTHHTLNPWEGCQKVGPGCDNCYAEARDIRFTGGTHWGPGAPRRRTSVANWRKPLAWDRAAALSGERHRVFCASLADVFDNAVDPAWREDLFRLIATTPNLDWMLLTKRPGNIAKMLPPSWGAGWHNVWLGCTIVNRDEMERDAGKLHAVSAAIRFWSVEPLLGDLGRIPSHLQPDLIIVGGESGPHARPMHPDWARSLRDQCQAAGVAFFFKQWGEFLPAGQRHGISLGPDASGRAIDLGSALRDGQALAMDGLWTYRVGKKAAGRLLDGREWNQMPVVSINTSAQKEAAK